MKHQQTSEVVIHGMHCPSCEILVANEFKKIKSVKEVKANFKTGTAFVTCVGELPKYAMNKVLKPYGYSINTTNNTTKDAHTTNVTEIMHNVLIVFAIGAFGYFFLKELNLWPDITVTEINLGSAFLLGLIASVSTCMATTGALFAGISSQKDYSYVHGGAFIIGRIISYTVAGLLLGAFGKLVGFSSVTATLLQLITAILLLFIALDILGLIKIGNYFGNTHVFTILQNKFEKLGTTGSFLLGFITYILPCGFTASVSVYAAGLGNLVESMLVLVLFALGTLPSLFIIHYITNFKKSVWYRWYVTAIAVLIITISVQTILSQVYILLPLYDQSQVTNVELPPVIDGKQIVTMTVDAKGYNPSIFTVKSGTPVLWNINGQNVYGCQGSIKSPTLGIDVVNLKQGENTVEFTPIKKGIFAFSCSMGMYNGTFKVI